MDLNSLITLLESGRDEDGIPVHEFTDGLPGGIIFNTGELSGEKLLKVAKGLMPEFATVPVFRPGSVEDGKEFEEGEVEEKVEEVVVDVTEEADEDELIPLEGVDPVPTVGGGDSNIADEAPSTDTYQPDPATPVTLTDADGYAVDGPIGPSIEPDDEEPAEDPV